MLGDVFREVFEPGLIAEIEGAGTVMELQDGDVAMDIGKTIRIMPFVLSGALKVLRRDEEGRELLLYYIGAGESCAMTFMCCMQRQPSEIKAVAEGAAEVVAVPLAVMDEWMQKYPSWKAFVMRTIQGRFVELLRTIDQIAFQNLDERLVGYLREKSRVSGSSLINLSHEQIAAELATSRVVISRLLKKLEESHRILLYRHQIKLLREL